MDGQSRSFDRVGKSWRVPCWGAAVLGGIQPRKMAAMAPTMDPDGLLQRFIPIVGDDVHREGADREPDAAALTAYERTIAGLAEILTELASARITLSPEAQIIRQRFERRLAALLDMPRASAAWRGHIGKWPGFFARILLVFHMLDAWETDGATALGMSVSGATAERAANFSKLLLAHAIRFYETVIGLGDSGKAARQAAGIILVNSAKNIISKRDLYEAHREWRPREPAAGELLEAMHILSRCGWCKPVGDGVWEINAQVHVRFKDRATAEAERRRIECAKIAASVAERRAIVGGSILE